MSKCVFILDRLTLGRQLYDHLSAVKSAKYEGNGIFFYNGLVSLKIGHFLGFLRNFKNSLYPFFVASNVLQAKMHQPIFCCQYIEKIIVKWVKLKLTFVSAI